MTDVAKTKISEEILQMMGWHRVDMGFYVEYYYSLENDYNTDGDKEFKIAVFFQEWKSEDFRVWLFLAGGATYCKGVQTIEQLRQLYYLVKGEESKLIIEKNLQK